jgi:plastocyanin
MTRTTRTGVGRLLTAAAGAVLLAAGLVPAGAQATGGSGPSSSSVSRSGPRTWHVLVGAQADHRAIQTMGYYPKHIWIDQGDSVVWRANAAEIHTVTFLAHGSPCPDGALCTLPRGFSPADPLQATPQGGGVFDGHSYYNSGLLTSAHGDTGPLPPFVHVVRSYRLTFPTDLAPGTYWYLCLVHGRMQLGSVTVQTAGSPYPYSQVQYDRRARQGIARDVADGHRLWARARHRAHRLNRGRGPAVVLNGVMDARAMIMRYIPEDVTVRRGGRVRFLATSMAEPHTITFGNDETGCGRPPCNPEQPWNVTHSADGNLVATYPGRQGGFTGSPTQLNSGLMLGAPPMMTHLPQQLTVRFTRVHRYPYLCALHDYMGMVGVVRVRHR